MNNIKCPLCGTTYMLSTYGTPEQGYVAYSFECEKCRYELFRYKTLNGAVAAAEEFISKFPPIMRVNLGDFITYLSRSGQRITYAQIHKIDSYKCVIETSRGTCRPDDVLKWPWELEQEGGNEQ